MRSKVVGAATVRTAPASRQRAISLCHDAVEARRPRPSPRRRWSGRRRRTRTRRAIGAGRRRRAGTPVGRARRSPRSRRAGRARGTAPDAAQRPHDGPDAPARTRRDAPRRRTRRRGPAAPRRAAGARRTARRPASAAASPAGSRGAAGGAAPTDAPRSSQSSRTTATRKSRILHRRSGRRRPVQHDLEHEARADVGEQQQARRRHRASASALGPRQPKARRPASRPAKTSQPRIENTVLWSQRQRLGEPGAEHDRRREDDEAGGDEAKGQPLEAQQRQRPRPARSPASGARRICRSARLSSSACSTATPNRPYDAMPSSQCSGAHERRRLRMHAGPGRPRRARRRRRRSAASARRAPGSGTKRLSSS